MAALGLCCRAWAFLVALHGFLIAVVASLVAEHGLEGSWALVVLVHGFSWHVESSRTRESNPCPLHWQADSELDHEGSLSYP